MDGGAFLSVLGNMHVLDDEGFLPIDFEFMGGGGDCVIDVSVV